MMMFFCPSPKLWWCTEGVIRQIHNWSTEKIFVTDSHSEDDQVEMEKKGIQYDFYTEIYISLWRAGWLFCCQVVIWLAKFRMKLH